MNKHIGFRDIGQCHEENIAELWLWRGRKTRRDDVQTTWYLKKEETQKDESK